MNEETEKHEKLAEEVYTEKRDYYEVFIERLKKAKKEEYHEVLTNYFYANAEMSQVELETKLKDIKKITGISNATLKKTFYNEKRKWERVTYEPSEIKTTTEDLEILKNPNLFEKINEELDKQIVGEVENRKAIFLNGCGRWVENANIASYNLCINSESGAGKDFIAKKVLKIFPKENIVIRSRISPTTFTYWHNAKFEPDWDWNDKILLLSDISNSILNHEVFKLMVSDGTHSTVVINQMAVDIKIRGKPVMFITMASANPNNQMLRRFPFLNLDESINQTKGIKEQQALAAAEGKTLEYDKKITSALSKLKQVKVKIPFAPELVDSFPDSHIIMRTHFHRLLDYIKASAALFQYQRETDSDDFIIATTEDYDNATIPLTVTTSNPFMIPLTKKQKMLLDICKKEKDFSVKEIEPKVPFIVLSKLYEALTKLQELGFLESDMRVMEISKRPTRFYQFIDFKLSEIPKWSYIKSCRKKGIKGREGNEGIEGIKGNIVPNSSNNSPHSLNSPSKSTPRKNKFTHKTEDIEEKKIKDFEVAGKRELREIAPKKTKDSPKFHNFAAINHNCNSCGTTPCYDFNRKGQPLCEICFKAQEHQEEGQKEPSGITQPIETKKKIGLTDEEMDKIRDS